MQINCKIYKNQKQPPEVLRKKDVLEISQIHKKNMCCSLFFY